ncbi:hypothetical protein C8J57DRAFT_1223374 [Mycena rebaudengoi]|nr:hypothetical protein C8J57DRAFT_1223374 [Mycena rebaudengoi]
MLYNCSFQKPICIDDNVVNPIWSCDFATELRVATEPIQNRSKEWRYKLPPNPPPCHSPYSHLAPSATLSPLAAGIQKALRSTGGAIAEVLLLVDVLGGFAARLARLQAIKQSGFNPAATNAVCYAVATCEQLMKEFKTRLSAYEADFTSVPDRSFLGTVHNIVRKLRWVAVTEKDAMDLRTKLVGLSEILSTTMFKCALWFVSFRKTQARNDISEQSVLAKIFDNFNKNTPSTQAEDNNSCRHVWYDNCGPL